MWNLPICAVAHASGLCYRFSEHTPLSISSQHIHSTQRCFRWVDWESWGVERDLKQPTACQIQELHFTQQRLPNSFTMGFLCLEHRRASVEYLKNDHEMTNGLKRWKFKSRKWIYSLAKIFVGRALENELVNWDVCGWCLQWISEPEKQNKRKQTITKPQRTSCWLSKAVTKNR